nr:MAG TPA: hypothetical protein [Caudoviricetes sp.]
MKATVNKHDTCWWSQAERKGDRCFDTLMYGTEICKDCEHYMPKE